MQKVLVSADFLQVRIPERLAKWYETHLGISPVPTSDGQESWHQMRVQLKLPCSRRTPLYFGQPEQSWMINFRVADLKAMIAQLRAADIAVDDPQSYPNGDFARLHDPEGNPIELWEPKKPE